LSATSARQPYQIELNLVALQLTSVRRSVLAGIITSVVMLTACTPIKHTEPQETSTPVQARPLDEFIGNSGWHNQEELVRLAAQLAQRREELIAECMRGFGFEYLPDLGSSRFSITSGVLDQTRPDDREWVAQYGFGVVSGHRTVATGQERVGVDPNQEFVDSLTDAERAAYLLALDGPDIEPPPDDATAAEIEDWLFGTGCAGTAERQARSESPLFLRDSDEFAPLHAAISELNDRVREHPATLAALADWTNCMADAGHPGFEHPSSAAFQIAIEVFNIRMFAEDPNNIPGLAVIREREIDTALADYDCRQQTSFQNRMDAAAYELEAQFVADHRATLEAYRTAAAQRD